jgi:hypothetical protein
MSETFLSAISHSNFTQTSDLTPTQNQIDGLVSSLAEKTADAYALAGVFVGVGGGRAFHRGALSLFSPLTNFASGISAPLTQLTARVVGFAAESALFGITPPVAKAVLQRNLSLLNLYGEEGLGKTIVHSGVNLIAFKGAGVVSAQQSVVAQALLQTSAMVASQRASAFAGITDASRNGLGHQIIDAQSSVLTMWAGIHCLHQLTPNSAPRQSAKVLEIEAKQAGITSRRKYDSYSSLKPAVELAGIKGEVIAYEPQEKLNPQDLTTSLSEINSGDGTGGPKVGEGTPSEETSTGGVSTASEIRSSSDIFRRLQLPAEQREKVYNPEPQNPQQRSAITVRTDASEILAALERLRKERENPFFRVVDGTSQSTTIAVDPHAGSFPKITHGGLVGYIGAHVIEANRQINLLRESKITVSLRQPLKPGKNFIASLNGDEKTSSVEIKSTGEGPSLASIKWEPLAEGPPSMRSQLANLKSEKSGDFQCIESCVALGLNNPIGLKLKANYHLGADGKAEKFWAFLNSQPGMELSQQLMVIDELGWLIGAAVSGKMGVSVKYEYRSIRPPSSSESLIVIAERSGSFRKIPVYVLTQSGEPIAWATVTYIPDENAARAGLGSQAEYDHIRSVFSRFLTP